MCLVFEIILDVEANIVPKDSQYVVVKHSVTEDQVDLNPADYRGGGS